MKQVLPFCCLVLLLMSCNAEPLTAIKKMVASSSVLNNKMSITSADQEEHKSDEVNIPEDKYIFSITHILFDRIR